jgi:hypothetical protein
MSRIKIHEVDKDVYMLSSNNKENFMYASGEELRSLLDEIPCLFEEINNDEGVIKLMRGIICTEPYLMSNPDFIAKVICDTGLHKSEPLLSGLKRKFILASCCGDFGLVDTDDLLSFAEKYDCAITNSMEKFIKKINEEKI